MQKSQNMSFGASGWGPQAWLSIARERALASSAFALITKARPQCVADIYLMSAIPKAQSGVLYILPARKSLEQFLCASIVTKHWKCSYAHSLVSAEVARFDSLSASVDTARGQQARYALTQSGSTDVAASYLVSNSCKAIGLTYSTKSWQSLVAVAV